VIQTYFKTNYFFYTIDFMKSILILIKIKKKKKKKKKKDEKIRNIKNNPIFIYYFHLFIYLLISFII